jgi:hypothetical protein
MMIVKDNPHEGRLYYKMFSRSINDTSRVIRMMIVGDATTWSVTSDNSRGVICDPNVFIIQATGGRNWKLIYPDANGSVLCHLVEKHLIDKVKTTRLSINCCVGHIHVCFKQTLWLPCRLNVCRPNVCRPIVCRPIVVKPFDPPIRFL